jgi:ribosomal protein S25
VQNPPAFKVVAAELRAKIVSGELETGGQLPSASQLRETYGVSGTVVRDALSELRHEGLIVSQIGKGVFVAEQNDRYQDAYAISVVVNETGGDAYLGVVFTDSELAYQHAGQVDGIVEKLKILNHLPQRMLRHLRVTEVFPDGRVTTIYANAEQLWDYEIEGDNSQHVNVEDRGECFRVTGSGPDEAGVEKAVRHEVTMILEWQQEALARRDAADEITRLGQEMGFPE